MKSLTLMKTVLIFFVTIIFITIFIFSWIEMSKQLKKDAAISFSNTIIVDDISYSCENGSVLSLKQYYNTTGYYLISKILFHPNETIENRWALINVTICTGKTRSVIDECSKKYILQKNGIICYHEYNDDHYAIYPIYDYVEKIGSLSNYSIKMIILVAISATVLFVTVIASCFSLCKNKESNTIVPSAPMITIV